jgi:hypothetical protein
MALTRQPRRSACAIRSREHELARLRRTSIEDRIKAALSMGDRFSWLKPKAKDG